jgi:DNA repair photolyase
MRRMNRTWGQDLRPAIPEEIKKKLRNGLYNKKPQSKLAWALYRKKTIRLGNKTDPYQDCEKEHRVTRQVVQDLVEMNWSFIIQTKFTNNVEEDMEYFKPGITHFMPIISPGLERDWEILEREKTSSPYERITFCEKAIKAGYGVGVNGEPFIPGYHTIKDFEDTIKLLKSFGIRSYNTYHLHFNDLVAKNFYELGLDIEKIWEMNKDENWRPILLQLIDLARKYDIILGCPDFINSGEYQSKANTCCGMDVPNPCNFNIIEWKKRKLKGQSDEQIIEETFDGIGDKKEALEILTQKSKEFYGYKDIVWNTLL